MSLSLSFLGGVGMVTGSRLLRRRIRDELGWPCHVPEHLERAVLE